ncbi:hypothetical protein A0256_18340 [Mucilaginibacter sp. PAMC 26640]|nr:hypothetical protein A0256_18340 [Mucilaginibacter sp. PAMC 26640]
MKIKITSILVNDQDKAHNFYTDVLGFVTKQNIPLGEFKWLTVTAPEAGDEVELLLEPNQLPAAKTFQAALFEQGIPSTIFNVDDINSEYERLKGFGVEFKTTPMQAGPVKIAVLNDTCGNWIQLLQV